MQELSPTSWEEPMSSQLSDSYTLLTQPVPSHPALLHKDSSFHGATTVLNILRVMNTLLHDDYVEKKQGVRLWQQTEHDPSPIFHGKIQCLMVFDDVEW